MILFSMARVSCFLLFNLAEIGDQTRANLKARQKDCFSPTKANR